MSRSRVFSVALSSAVIVVLVGCSTGGAEAGADARAPSPPSTTAEPTTTPAEPSRDSPSPTPTPSKPSTRTQTASLTIPEIGLKNLRVVPYEGTTDDWPGTRIQNEGVAASPYGSRGGVGPGEIGNYLVTAHRLSAGGPLRDLPALDKGDSVTVTSGGTVYEYEITDTRSTSFRSERSLAEQRAAVPGHPGRQPTEAMITISTCATPEDDAAGNFWRDDKGNPEHRIDKIGVLTSTE
ncbi:class E sortase [Streptomyces yerevanensis]|uniref:class E sortase n=1 Tax=Streptomyces yerevanensis TaxID=66378 RepID=UPI00068B7E9F|nr:class E sortase [Streptomyces yerevanensis]